MNKAAVEYIQLVYFYRLILIRYFVLFNLVSLLAETEEEPLHIADDATPGEDPSLEKTGKGETPLKGNGAFLSGAYRCVYFYHGDHLGSSNYITDAKGRVFEHVLYLPYGETWIDESHDESLLPYKFSGKEIDPETGYYNFGHRYMDAKFSNWISTDPAINDYLPKPDQLYFPEKTLDPFNQLKGMGGVYNSKNLNLYHYAGLNPIKLSDPNGMAAADNMMAFTKGLALGFGGGIVGTLLAGAFISMIAGGSTAGVMVGGAGLAVMVGAGVYGTYQTISDLSGGKLSETDKWELTGMVLGGLLGGGLTGKALSEVSSRFGPELAKALSDVHPSTPVGSKNTPLNVKPGTNTPTTINGRKYTGHALDRMQGRGVMPSVVEDTIQNGKSSAGRDGATIYTTDQMKVIVNPNGSVKTVYPISGGD